MRIMGTKKKVCVITSVHSDLDVRVFHKECKTLVKAGHEVVLVSQYGKDKMLDDIRMAPLKKRRTRFARILLGGMEALKLAFKENADVYHFHNPELIFVGMLLKITRGAIIVYDVHENTPAAISSKEWIPRYMRSIMRKLFLFSERACIPFFDRIIVAGDDIAENYSHIDKVTVLKNYPFLESGQSSPPRTKQRKEINLIYIGGLSAQRGILQLVEAVKLIKDKSIKLFLVGGCSDAKFKKRIAESIDDKTFLVEQVSYDKVFEYLHMSDVGVILFLPEPNHIFAIQGGRNNKIFEYMAAGLPILGSDLPGWREKIEEKGYGIVVDPLDPQAIANGIKKLKDSPDLRTKMGAAGRKDFLEKYNWEKEKNKLLTLYEQF